jgi:putative metallohydrolase (TIGR04338 family)
MLETLAMLEKLGIAVPVRRTRKKRASRRRASPAARDFQRGRVYRWEGEHVLPLDREILSLEECRRLVERVYRRAEAAAAHRPDWRPPAVSDGRGRRHACGSRGAIKLPRWARTRPVVLHECAHGLADDKHGPRFVARYVELLEHFLGLDRASLHVSLARHRVRIAIADELRPPLASRVREAAADRSS